MNHRLALIDRVAEVVHDERRRTSPDHCGPVLGSCTDCRDHATFIVDEVAPILAAHQAPTEQRPTLNAAVSL